MPKITRKIVEGAIISHFGSKKKCAEILGFSESTLSRNLKNLPESFIQRLKGVGVPFDKLTEESINHNDNDIKEAYERMKDVIVKLTEENIWLREKLIKYESKGDNK